MTVIVATTNCNAFVRGEGLVTQVDLCVRRQIMFLKDSNSKTGQIQRILAYRRGLRELQ